MKVFRAVAMLVCGLAVLGVSRGQTPAPPSRWTQPAAELAGQIAELLGPGQAFLTVRNLSTIKSDDVAEIRKLVEQDLKARGVMSGGVESANAIRITLSEDLRERLWVAEIIEGSETRVAMVHVDPASAALKATTERMMLRRERITEFVSRIGGNVQEYPVVDAAEVNGEFIVMYPDRISIFGKDARGWSEANTFVIEKKLARDPRGVVVADAGGSGFSAWVPGAECAGSFSAPVAGAKSDSGWSVHCHTSDDPWPVYQSSDTSAPALRAFYNSARNFFTGVVTPSVGVDLPAFYTAGMVPRAAGGAALLIAGIDGKVQLAENGALHLVAGTRDWGSDFAVVRSGCGTGTQVITSGSGQGTADSLRAFEISALEAVPASGPLTIDGSVTGLWSAPDGKSVFAVVRTAADSYEVDRVTALCN
jgi:hypothetical protein